VEALSLDPGMGPQDLSGLIHGACSRLGPSLILVDMLGGTPWNASLWQGLPQGCELLSGLSLPLLLEALADRGLPPSQLAESLLSKAPGIVVSASRMLKERGK
jgi:mannose/fructose-specific phosphotransferase system component IIA